MTSRKISKISAWFFAMARKLANISKFSCAKETLQDDQWKSLLSCFKSFKWAIIGEIMQQKIWMQFQTLVQQRVFPAPMTSMSPPKIRPTSISPPHFIMLPNVAMWMPQVGRVMRKLGQRLVSDLQWKSLKVGKVRMHSIREGFVHSQWLKMGFECSFDRNFTNFRPLFGKIIQLDLDFFNQFFSKPLGALMRATFHILNWAHFDQHLHLRLQVLNCWWSQRPRHWNEGSRKELGTVGVILIKLINPQKKRTHFLKNTTKKPSPKSQLGMIRVPVISFTIFYQWLCLPMFGIIFVSPTLGTRKVNALDRHSDTPLSWAARSGHLDAVGEDPATKRAKIFWEFHGFSPPKKGWA